MNDLFIQGLTIDWNRVRPYNYVRQIPAISGIDTFTFHKPITFFVGENGSGKSTLLEAIAVAYGFNAEGGTKNYCKSSRFHKSIKNSLLLEALCTKNIVKG